MKMYRDMTVPELVEHALDWRGANPATSRVVYALAKRLERTYTAAQYQPTLPPGYIKVAKPHISLARAMAQDNVPVMVHFHIWRCEGPLGSTAYGGTPTGAYHAWLRLLTQPVRIRRS